MKGIIKTSENKIEWRYDDEIMWIESFGKNSLRVRITKESHMPEINWAFVGVENNRCEINISDGFAKITNGRISAIINHVGVVSFMNAEGAVFLKEKWQDRQDESRRMSLMTSGRSLKPIQGGKYKCEMTFEPNDGEKIFGMGQYQIPDFNLKGCNLELAQRNSQVSIPFYQSSLGYGFMWHNPAIGQVIFANNHTKFTSEISDIIDYWVTVGENPDEINRNYIGVIGKPSTFPDYAIGLWQSKLRYKNQDELLAVAREYYKRKIPVSVIVCDFFHWSVQGDWSFDKKYWPDPKGMVDELKSMGMELMVSIWTTVDPRSENYAQMKKNGYLVRTDSGVRTQMVCLGADVFYDATNPDAQKYLFEKVKQNYMKYGINLFWLDVAEPEYTTYDFENYRYFTGSCISTGNYYPKGYAKGFYDGLKKENISSPITLIRSAWFGSASLGAILWSGDIHSRFEVLRNQFAAGLNVSLCGIPWWTTDIGGFYGGDPNSGYFRELIIRWFQFGVFCPVFRLHGWRMPTGEDTEKPDSGLFDFDTCGDNEIWSFGEKEYEIIKDLVFLREAIKPYLRKLFDEAANTGRPLMRPVFYDFFEDDKAWEVDYEFMFGPDILVAPVLFEGMRERAVYLPKGTKWIEYSTKVEFEGGQIIEANAPIDVLPFYIRQNSDVAEILNKR